MALTLVDTVTANASSVTLPDNVVQGDAMVLCWKARNASGTPSQNAPTGWTGATNANAGIGTVRIRAAYKIATSSDAGATVSLGASAGDAENHMNVLVFRGDGPITALAFQDGAAEVTGVDPASQTANASAGTTPLVVVGCYGSNAVVSPRTFSPAEDSEVNSNGTDTWYTKWRIDNSSPSDTTIDQDDEGNRNTLMSFYIEATEDLTVPFLSFEGEQTDNTTASVFTFTNAAPANSFVVVGVHAEAAAGPTISSVSIAGTNGTSAIAGSEVVGDRAIAGLYYRNNTGAAGDIVVTFSADVLRCIISVWVVTNSQEAPLDNDTATADPSTGLSWTVDIPAKAVAIAVQTNGNDGTPATWTPDEADEQYDADLGGATTQFMGAGIWPISGSDRNAQSITTTHASSDQGSAGIVAVWGVAETIVSAGLTSTTASALAISAARSHAVGLATTTASALAATSARGVTVGIPATTASALALSSLKEKAVGLASTTASALALTANRSHLVGIPSTTAAALAATAVRAHAVGIPSTTASALTAAAVRNYLCVLAGEGEISDADLDSHGFMTDQDVLGKKELIDEIAGQGEIC